MEPSAQAHDHCSGDVANAFAQLLLLLGRGEAIRSVEAIAATIANQVQSRPFDGNAAPSSSDDPISTRQESFARHLASLAAPLDTTSSRARADDGAYACCLRIARRALATALADPTGGATRFHPVDQTPTWSRGRLPCATIGGFVFYRDEPSLLDPEPSA